MRKFTVIGFYPEAKDSRFADVFEGRTADDAEEAALDARQGLVVVGVVPGAVHLEDTRWQINGGD